MDKINHCINHNRFIPIDTEELSALELIGKGAEKTNELVDKSNNHEERITNNEKNKVSFDDMKNKYQLTTENGNTNYEGMWQGLNKPTLSEEGAHAQTEKNMNDIKDLTSQLDSIEQQNSINVYLTDFPKISPEVDDTQRLQRAIDSLNGVAGNVLLGVIGLTVSNTIYFRASGQKLIGVSTNGTTITANNSITILATSIDYMVTTVNRCHIENILFETKSDNSIIFNYRGFNYTKVNNCAFVIRGSNSKAIHGTCESGLNGYYNSFINCDLASYTLDGTVGYSFVNNPKANNVVGANRRASNACLIIGGRVSGFEKAYVDVGVGNRIMGTTFESNKYDLTLGSDDTTIFNVGTTNHTVILGTYHEGGTTTDTVITVNQSSARVNWLPSNVTGNRKVVEDNGVRTNILFFGSSTPALMGKILGYIEMENLQIKDGVLKNTTTFPSYMFDNGTFKWTLQNAYTGDSARALRVWNLTDNKLMYQVSANGNGQFGNGVTGGAFDSTSRPTNVKTGTMIFDTTLNKPIWFGNASKWYDSTGTQV